MRSYQGSGLGTTICLLSHLIHHGVKELRLSDNSISASLIKTFDISKGQIKIDYQKGNFDTILDNCKFFSPYYKPEKLRYKGKTIPVNKSKTKPCVGVSMYHMDKSLQKGVSKLKKDVYPDYKFYPLEYNTHLMKVLIEAGYDVIMLDNINVSLEDKIYLLSEYCDMVIGYEGGLHHLAHCLDIPCIIFPHNNLEHGAIDYINSLHLDLKTHFIHNQTQILDLTVNTLLNIRSKLIANLGNNRFLKGRVGISNDFERYQFQYGKDRVTAVPFPNDIKNRKNLKIGGIKKFHSYD